jgi:hypothetical protein
MAICAKRTAGVDPKRAFRFGLMEGREAPESGLPLEASSGHQRTLAPLFDPRPELGSLYRLRDAGDIPSR